MKKNDFIVLVAFNAFAQLMFFFTDLSLISFAWASFNIVMPLAYFTAARKVITED